MRVWLNGSLVDESAATVSVFDHGLVVGDGVFETVKVVGGHPFALRRHLDRLRRSALGLGIGEPDLDAIADGAAQVSAGAGGEPARLRITVTAGPGPLGSVRGSGPLTAVVALAPIAAWPDASRVAVVPWARNERGALTGLKTTSYGENVRALAYARERGADEAIFGNLVGNLCEGTGSNVFVVSAGRLYTSPLGSGCLAGITRELVLQWCGGEEVDLPLAALGQADEAFLTSTTRDVMPIAVVDGRALPSTPGPVTRKAMTIFAERAATDLDP